MARSTKSKYRTVTPRLAKFELTEELVGPAWVTIQQEQEDLQRQFGAHAPLAYAHRFLELKARKKALERDLKTINAQIAGVEQMTIRSWERPDPEWGTYGASPNAFKLVEGGTITLTAVPYTSVTDRAQVQAYFRAHDLDRYLIPNGPKLNSLNADRLEQKLDPLDGTTVFKKETIRYRAAGAPERAAHDAPEYRSDPDDPDADQYLDLLS